MRRLRAFVAKRDASVGAAVALALAFLFWLAGDMTMAKWMGAVGGLTAVLAVAFAKESHE